jgi:hypothetical protein
MVDHLEQSARNELARKTNSCTTVNLIFQDAVKSENSKGLNYETAAAYRKIMESNPGSVFARQAEKKVSEYERNDQATLRAYKALQKADYKSTSEAQQITADELKQLTQGFLEKINLYGDIDLTNVDPLLSEHITNSIAAFQRARSLFLEIEAERNTIVSKMEENIKRWGEYWRDYYVKQAQTEFTNVLTKYVARLQTFSDEMKKLDELDKTVVVQIANTRQLTAKCSYNLCSQHCFPELRYSHAVVV